MTREELLEMLTVERFTPSPRPRDAKQLPVVGGIPYAYGDNDLTRLRRRRVLDAELAAFDEYVTKQPTDDAEVG